MFKRSFVAVMLCLVLALAAAAANLDKATADTEGRRKAAENGLRQIKAQSAQQADAVRPLYTEAATHHNTWLDLVGQAIERGDATAPDVTAVAQRAAASLVEWVNVRNRALGLPELTRELGDSVQMVVVRDLSTIAGDAWKNTRRANDRRRAQAVSTLGTRLRWSAWDDIR